MPFTYIAGERVDCSRRGKLALVSSLNDIDG